MVTIARKKKNPLTRSDEEEKKRQELEKQRVEEERKAKERQTQQDELARRQKEREANRVGTSPATVVGRSEAEAIKSESETASFNRRAEKAASEQGISSREGRRQVIAEIEEERRPELEGRERQAIQDSRREEFQEVTGSGSEIEEVLNKIKDPLDLTPKIFNSLDKQKQEDLINSRFFQPLGISGTSATVKLLEDPQGEFKRAGLELAAGSGVGTAEIGIGVLSRLFAKKAVTKSVTGANGSVGLLSKAIKSTGFVLGAIFIGKSVLDINGGEMETMRRGLATVVSDGERIENLAKAGLPTADTIPLLSTMADEVDEAEQRIKELSIYSLEYKVNKEYEQDMKLIRSARLAILRRLEAVENVAVTGSAALSPEQLIFHSQFEENL